MAQSRLAGKHVAVVGGSSGIGLAAARRLPAEGATVTIASRSAERLASAAGEIGGARTLTVDIRDAASVDAFAERLGAVDHLVITASDAVMGSYLDLDVEAVRGFFDSKFFGPYRLARAVVPKIRPGGSITFCSGAAGRRASPGFAYGSALNAAIDALSASLAVELAPIRVNTISPGIIETPVWTTLMSEADRDEVFASTSAKVPARRVGSPDDVAEGIVFLLASEYTTGHVLVVDGGYVHA